MKTLGQEIALIRSRCIADRRGYKPNTSEYAAAVSEIYSQALLVESEKKTHIVPAYAGREGKELSALRTITAQLALRALSAGASATEILAAINYALDSASEAASTPIERVG